MSNNEKQQPDDRISDVLSALSGAAIAVGIILTIAKCLPVVWQRLGIAVK